AEPLHRVLSRRKRGGVRLSFERLQALRDLRFRGLDLRAMRRELLIQLLLGEERTLLGELLLERRDERRVLVVLDDERLPFGERSVERERGLLCFVDVVAAEALGQRRSGSLRLCAM